MLYHIYCDESRQTKDRFMIFSGIIIPEKTVDVFEKTMKKYRNQTNMHSELKWSKVSKQKLNEYKVFIDFFFALNNTDKIHFKSLAIDNHKVKHKIYNNGNKEVGFYKFYYQLFMAFSRTYYHDNSDKFIIYPDYRNTSYSLKELKKILNHGVAKKQNIHTSPFRSIEPKNSKNSEAIQLNDLILGAIGYQMNGYHQLAKSSAAKIELCKYIAKKAGLSDLTKGTRYGQNRFTIWNFLLK